MPDARQRPEPTAEAAPGGPASLPARVRTAQRALAALGRLELWVVVATLGAICSLTAATVVLRYFFEVSVVWAQEISLLLFHVLIFTGAAVMYKTRAYITMDFVVLRVPRRVQRACALATWIRSAGVCAPSRATTAEMRS